MLKQLLKKATGRRYNLFCKSIETDIVKKGVETVAIDIDDSALPEDLDPIMPKQKSLDRRYIRVLEGADTEIEITLNNGRFKGQEMIIDFVSKKVSVEIELKDASGNTLDKSKYGFDDENILRLVWLEDPQVWRPSSSRNVARTDGENSGHYSGEAAAREVFPIGHVLCAGSTTASPLELNEKTTIHIINSESYGIGSSTDNLDGLWANRGVVSSDGSLVIRLFQRVD